MPDKLYHSAAVIDQSGDSVYIQTPMMKVVSVMANDGDPKKSCIDLDISDDAFYQLLRYIDTHIIHHVFKNRETWFKNVEVTMAAVEDSYRSPIQKGSTTPVVRFRLNVTDAVHTQLYVGRQEAQLDNLKPDMKAAAIVQLKGLVMNKGSICPDWTVHCLKTEAVKPSGPLFSEAY